MQPEQLRSPREPRGVLVSSGGNAVQSQRNVTYRTYMGCLRVPGRPLAQEIVSKPRADDRRRQELSCPGPVLGFLGSWAAECSCQLVDPRQGAQ